MKKDVKKIDQIIVGLCSPPTLTEISKGRLRVEWCPPERGGEALASSSVLFYQLNRTNIYPTSMIYQGSLFIIFYFENEVKSLILSLI